MDMLLTAGERITMALLCMAVEDLGLPAVSFTGSQAGILTDTEHGKAKIIEVKADRIREALAAGRVAVVAGFQGVSTDRDITTLGRGGSDTTAVAIAAALGAEVCEIYTDVDGIYTADPRIVPAARKLGVCRSTRCLRSRQPADAFAPAVGRVCSEPRSISTCARASAGRPAHGSRRRTPRWSRWSRRSSRVSRTTRRRQRSRSSRFPTAPALPPPCSATSPTPTSTST